MVRRPITTLCPEGWYYLFVVAFILGGAALRGMNLLIILAGAMIGPLLFNWRVARLMLRRLRVDRQLPPRVFAGQAVTVSVTLHNARSALTSWAVMIEDRIQRVDLTRAAQPQAVRIMVSSVAPGQDRVVNYRSMLTRRGSYSFGPMRTFSRFPLGLAKASMIADDAAAKLLVCPRLGRVTRRWNMVTQQQHVGSLRTARQHGVHEGDYYGLREWRPGDSQRWIHWRTSAKLGELSVRQFEQQRSRDFSLILDMWQPLEPTERDLLIVETAVSFLATAVGDVCRHGGAHVTIGVLGTTMECWSGSASNVLASEVWDHLAVAQAGHDGDVRQAITCVQHRANPSAQTIVLSTRSRSASESAGENETGSTLTRRKLTWIDCGNGEEAEFFAVDAA